MFDLNNAEFTVSVDESSFGPGAVLLQKNSKSWQPVVFAYRVMSKCQYAQIEKGALAIEKFSSYILSKAITIETDHKPLVPLMGSKSLDSLPPRVLRFRLRQSRFEYLITNVPGKQWYTMDTLSRAPVSPSESSNLQDKADLLLALSVDHLPASSQHIDTIK